MSYDCQYNRRAGKWARVPRQSRMPRLFPQLAAEQVERAGDRRPGGGLLRVAHGPRDLRVGHAADPAQHDELAVLLRQRQDGRLQTFLLLARARELARRGVPRAANGRPEDERVRISELDQLPVPALPRTGPARLTDDLALDTGGEP